MFKFLNLGGLINRPPETNRKVNGVKKLDDFPWPDRLRVMSKPKGEVFKKGRVNGLTNDELKLIENQVFRVTNEVEVTEEHRALATEWIKEFVDQNEESKRIFNEVRKSDLFLKNFVHAFLHCATLGEKPLINFLYGDLFSISKHRVKLNKIEKDKYGFSEFRTFVEIRSEAKRINEENDRQVKANKYAKDFLVLIKKQKIKPDFEFLSEGFTKEALIRIFGERNPKHWHNEVFMLWNQIYPEDGGNTVIKILDSFVKRNYSADNPQRKEYFRRRKLGEVYPIMNEEFFAKINPDKKPEQVGEGFSIVVDGENKKVKMWELFSKADLRKEGKALEHCIGDSDFYLNKIRKGEIRIFSVRDEEGQPVYTIEYDVHRSVIRQIKGYEDEVPKALVVNQVVDFLTAHRVEVLDILEREMTLWIKDDSRVVQEVLLYMGPTVEEFNQFLDYISRGYRTSRFLQVRCESFNQLQDKILDLLNIENIGLSFRYLLKSPYTGHRPFDVSKIENLEHISASLSDCSDSFAEADGPGWGVTAREVKEYRYTKLKEVKSDLDFDVRHFNMDFPDDQFYNYPKKDLPFFPSLETVGGVLTVNAGEMFSGCKRNMNNLVRWFKINFPALKYQGLAMKDDADELIEKMKLDGKLKLTIDEEVE